MPISQLEPFWKALLVILTLSQAVLSAGYLIGRWQQKQEGATGSQATNIRRLEADVAKLREWRHEVAQEETKDMAALYRGFVSRDVFDSFVIDRRNETDRIWAELARLRNGKH